MPFGLGGKRPIQRQNLLSRRQTYFVILQRFLLGSYAFAKAVNIQVENKSIKDNNYTFLDNGNTEHRDRRMRYENGSSRT